MPLIERDRELSLLDSILLEATQRRGKTVVLSGAVGTGKTLLAREAADRWLQQGALVLSATSSPAEESISLGVVRQLFAGADLAPDQSGAAEKLIEAGIARTEHPPTSTIIQPHAEIAEKLWCILVAASEKAPIILVIDDTRYADPLSLQFLLYFVRRVRLTRIFMVFIESDHVRPPHPLFRAELMQQPELGYLRLPLLSRNGVAALLSQRLGPVAAESIEGACAELAGGNPLLTAALATDHETAGSPGSAEAVEPDQLAGESFGQAVALLLGRLDPEAREAAEALALVGSAASAELLGEVLQIGTPSAERALRSVGVTGLLHKGRFRHPVTRRIVLEQMADEPRAALQLRAARVLYESGAPSENVAEHLLGVRPDVDDGSMLDTWGVTALKEAADHALDSGHPHRAEACLERAHLLSTDKGERAAILASLARLLWKHSPRAAFRRLAPIMSRHHQEGHITSHDFLLVRYLLHRGQLKEARKLLHCLMETADSSPETAEEMCLLRAWLPVAFPGVAEQFSRDLTGSDTAETVSERNVLPMWTTALLGSVLSRTAGDGDIKEAEQALRVYQLNEDTFDPLVSGLTALIYADRAGSVNRWCAALLAEAERMQAPSWRATFLHLRAETALQTGELETATRCAKAALTEMPAKEWGTDIGYPVAALVLAQLAAGRVHEAGEALRLGDLDTSLHNRSCLHYRYARGHYYLATDKPHAALRDFTDAGALMRRWNMDTPGLVSWRSGAAEALTRMGKHARAKGLVDEQLGLLRGDSRSRSYGMALRQLAAVSEPERRPEILRRAAEVLKNCGDRYGLARVLRDLVDAHEVLGESHRARHIARRARRVAEACGAEALVAQLSSCGEELALAEHPAVAEGGGLGGADELSKAEEKVAMLASLGYSNREIGQKLHITISTVEQHLTRVYRKLSINRREDLSPALFQSNAVLL
ncbi:LuxR family transcriptional regulator [Streptomyces sp. NBC_01275]|uniref:helix-turn-helix transcriptional regulator n=1 Tax=Streptomyces sp. NBC_01275 TaxID=2903807 RepID=UPI002252DC03|nr:LuxR family transcriptional regulator [Streptomyces sp. NBC_01275]MCX4760232.1 LuxR family transcriptional regulator [Streptomyces sp. NBC_01275]